MSDEPYATCFNIIRFGRYLDVYSVRRNGHPYKGGFSLQILNPPYKYAIAILYDGGVVTNYGKTGVCIIFGNLEFGTVTFLTQ